MLQCSRGTPQYCSTSPVPSTAPWEAEKKLSAARLKRPQAAMATEKIDRCAARLQRSTTRAENKCTPPGCRAAHREQNKTAPLDCRYHAWREEIKAPPVDARTRQAAASTYTRHCYARQLRRPRPSALGMRSPWFCCCESSLTHLQCRKIGCAAKVTTVYEQKSMGHSH
jgi:hypothetical protein